MFVAKNVLLVAFALSYVFLGLAENEAKVSTKQENNSEENETTEEFKPTHEWKTVRKGQPVPRGLHVRMNLQTGETEAKLLSESPKSRTDLSVHDDGHPKPEDDTESDKHTKAIKDSLLKLEREEKDAADDLADAVRQKFRSYKELKETFHKLNMTVKTDLEIMNELVSKFKALQRRRDKSAEDEKLTVLTDLEYLVHQFDNALEFVRLDGVSDIVLPMMNCTRADIRAEAARLLGSAAQSNIRVQIAALENGAISALLKAVSLDSYSVVRTRSLYAISCLIRNFPAAQARFVREGGLSVLSQLFEKGKENHRLQVRVITLLHDLLTERQDTARLLSEVTAVNKVELEMKLVQYKAVGLEQTLHEHGWCSRVVKVLLDQDQSWTRTKKRDDLTSAVTDLPVRPEHDFVEKVCDALLSMVDICRSEFRTNSDLNSMISGLKEWYKELAMKENLNKLSRHSGDTEDGDSDSYLYYSGMANTLEKLSEELNKRAEKDEL